MPSSSVLPPSWASSAIRRSRFCFDQIGGALERRGALAPRASPPMPSKPATAASIAAGRQRRIRLRHGADDGCRSAGDEDRRGSPPLRALARRSAAPRRRSASATASTPPRQRRQDRRGCRTRPRASSCARRRAAPAARSRHGAAMRRRQSSRPAASSRLSTGTSGSLTALTKEEFAPFSRSRRTR